MTVTSAGTGNRLDIIIPTYNRNQNLVDLLRSLIPSVETYPQNVLYTIIDNKSDESVENTITSQYPELMNCNFLSVIRNESNIGMSANIMKCFEISSADWVWVIGDDDPLTFDSLQLVISSISRVDDDVIFINFNSPWVSRTKNLEFYGLEDFVTNLDSFKNSIFLPTTVYRNSSIKSYIHLARTQLKTLIPHFGLQLLALNESAKHKVLLSQEYIFQELEFSSETSWSVLDFQINKPELLKLPLNISKKVHNNLENLILGDCQPLKWYAKLAYEKKKPLSELKFKLRQIFERNKMYKRGKSMKVILSNWLTYLLCYNTFLLSKFIKENHE